MPCYFLVLRGAAMLFPLCLAMRTSPYAHPLLHFGVPRVWSAYPPRVSPPAHLLPVFTFIVRPHFHLPAVGLCMRTLFAMLTYGRPTPAPSHPPNGLPPYSNLFVFSFFLLNRFVVWGARC